MANISTSDFQKGIFVQWKDEPHQIVEFQFVNPGKGSAFIRAKLKNFKTGKIQEFTFKSGETLPEIPINVREMQYLYKQADKCIFMDNSTYEQVCLSQDIIGNLANFLKEGDVYQIYMHNSQAVGIKIPKKVRLQVTEAEDAIKGNTVSGAKKLVKVETGVEVAVPLFIKSGDVLAIDPESGEYIERESQKAKVT